MYVPEPVPDFALRAAEIYRLEFGSKGLKVDQVVRNGTKLRQQREIDRRTEDMLGELDVGLKAVLGNLASHQKRLERIETRR